MKDVLPKQLRRSTNQHEKVRDFRVSQGIFPYAIRTEIRSENFEAQRTGESIKTSGCCPVECLRCQVLNDRKPT